MCPLRDGQQASPAWIECHQSAARGYVVAVAARADQAGASDQRLAAMAGKLELAGFNEHFPQRHVARFGGSSLRLPAAQVRGMV